MVTNTQTVTVLFTDMVGSTALSSSVDPATADTVRQEHFSVLRQALARADGTEVKSLGDGLMAVFSSTSAAIECAVAMQQGVDEANHRSPHTLGLRVGLSGGEVTVEDDDFFGDPVVEAARVCALCDAGQILVTDAVRFMVGRRSAHPLEPMGEQELKGLPDPVALFAVAWVPTSGGAAGVPLPDRLGTTDSTAFGFIGRVGEQEQLTDALKKAGTGSRQVVFLSGEPGIGKTSLCRQVAHRAHEQGVCVLYGRCDEDLGLPYQPFAEALAHLVIHVDDDVLAEHVRVHGGVLRTLVPALATRVPDLPTLQSADPDTERARLFAAVAAILAAASTDAVLLIVVDDLHWADSATLQLLAHLARAAQLGQVMVLGTYRDSELSTGNPLSDMLASMRREADVRRIDLVGLGDDEIVAMMAAAAGHELADDGVELAHAVRRETEGNPFFTTEMLFHLSESGLVRQGDDGLWVAADDLYERGLPQSVREVVGQRIDRLGDEARRVLAQAAVIGRDFDVELLAVVADIDEDDLLDLLDQVVAAGLVTDVEGAVDRYTFAHALTQHTLYDDLGASRRARAHRRIAEALEEICGPAVEGRAGELAHHYVAATKTADALKALTYSRIAGDQALAKLAPVDALKWFAQALELYEQIPPDEPLYCELLIGLGTAQRQTLDPAHRETLLQAAAIAERVGDRGRLVSAVLANFGAGAGVDAGHVDRERVAMLEKALHAVGEADSPERARLLATLCAELTYDPSTRKASVATEALAIARRLDDPVVFVRVVNAVYVAVATPDTLDDRLTDFGDAVAMAATIGDPHASYHANYGRAVACSQLGDRVGFEAHLDACISLADQLDQPYEYWSVACLRSVRSLMAGDVTKADDEAEAAVAIGGDRVPEALTVWGAQMVEIRRQQGRLDEMIDLFAQAAVDNPELPALRSGLGRMYCELDQPAEALAMIRPDIDNEFADFPYDITWLMSMLNIAHACVTLEQREPLPLLYDKLQPWQLQLASLGPTTLGPVALYLAMVAAALDDVATAERHFEQSLEVSERMRVPNWIAWTELEWAKVLRRRGQGDDEARADAMRSRALATARQHGFVALERRATAIR